MKAEYPIHIKCQFCSGTGEKTSQVGDNTATNICGACSGGGFIEHAVLIYPDGVTPSYTVFESFNAEEYNGLSAAKQRDLTVVLSAGFIDLDEGSNGMAVLGEVFGLESQTIANIKELI